MTPDEFRRAGHDLIELIVDYLEGIEQRPVLAAVEPGAVRAALPEHPPVEPEPWAAVAADIERVIIPGSASWQHPAWFAYFPANTSYASILGELLSAGLGQQGMNWVTSPACTEVETLMMDWMHELLGLPERFRSTSSHGGGVIQGSASEGNLVAALAARWRATEGAVNATGDTRALTAYCSAQTHSSVEKGLRIAGIGAERIRVVAHDPATLALDPDAFARAVAADADAGLRPFFVCATHGTTSSLAFDPTAGLADTCAEHDVWLHVDAAMSGIAAVAPELRWVNDGLDRADSYCTDPHKWMGINFDCSLFWTADRSALLGALSILPEYLRSEAAEQGRVIDYRDWQIPLGRRFRALKLWFALRLDGVTALQRFIRDDVAMTQELAAWIAADPRFVVAAPHPLNLVCLRLTPTVGESQEGANARTDALIDAVNASGQASVTRTVLDGWVVLRVSVGGRATERRHVAEVWDLIRASLPAA